MTASRHNSSGSSGSDTRTRWVLLAILLALGGGIVWVLASTRYSTVTQKSASSAVDAAADYATADLTQFFADINTGNTQDTLYQLLGHPQACLNKIQLASGIQEVCTWHNKDVGLVVVFLNGQVISKTKVGL